MTNDSSDDSTAHIATHLWEYAQDQDLLAHAAQDVRAYLEEVAQAASITVHAVEARAKSLGSYGTKAEKVDKDGVRRYTDPATQIHDCVAARVILFTTSAREDLVDLLSRRTLVLERKNPGDTKYNGYDSEHLVIKGLNDEDARARYPQLTRYLSKYPGLEIQLRSVASHAWAEYEHDVRYKAGAYQDLATDRKQQIDQWFIEAGGMRRVMDDLFAQIEATLITESPRDAAPAVASSVELDPEDTEGSDGAPIDGPSLSAFIAARHPGAERGDRTELEVVEEHLRRLDVETVGQLESALADVEPSYVAQLMDYPASTSGTRRLDDEILAAFTDRYVETAAHAEREQLLRLRLRRVRGKFAIYSIESHDSTSALMTAARTVRQLAALVAENRGGALAEVEGAISLDRGHLNASAKSRAVKTDVGVLYVATNLTRSAAEDIMRTLLSRISGVDVRVVRAGDPFLSATED